jgi:hypothetical protein
MAKRVHAYNLHFIDGLLRVGMCIDAAVRV